MSTLAPLMPVTLAAILLFLGGVPNGAEAGAAASFVGVFACLLVAVVFGRRAALESRHGGKDEDGRLYLRMLASIVAVALCCSLLLAYRGVNLFATATGNDILAEWFLENRYLGTAITLSIAFAMVYKLSYPLGRVFGRYWGPVIGAIGAALFAGFVALTRLF